MMFSLPDPDVLYDALVARSDAYEGRFEAATGVEVVEGYGLTEVTCLVSCMQETKQVTSVKPCLLYTSPSPRDRTRSRMPSSA